MDGKALRYASKNGHESIVRVLLQYGASVKYADNFKSSPLCVAAGHGHEAIIELLIRHGAQTEKHPMEDFSAFCLAAKHRHEAVVSKLLHHGADPDAQTQNQIPCTVRGQIGEWSYRETTARAWC